MKAYLLDTSAAVEIYLNPNRRPAKLEQILDQKRQGEAKLFMPNICIAEAFNTFARRHFAPKKDEEHLNVQDYQRCLNKFRDDIHWGKTIYPYDLNRYHIVGTDKIVLAEHKLPKTSEKSLSTFDILIIAMACELAYLGDRDNTWLVTNDKRMWQVCGELRNKYIPISNEGPLGRLDNERWIPPACNYLAHHTGAQHKAPRT